MDVTEPVIVLKNVTKTFMSYQYITAGFKSFLLSFPRAIRETKKRFVALRSISFEVYKGECFGIIGRNGAGKSTLLSLIAGVMKPDTGEIYVKGKVLPLLELGTGFHQELTGRENILLNGVLLGLTLREIEEKMPKIIEFSELKEFIDQPIRTYSSGMLARLGFSIIIHSEPDILLIDEILAVGDLSFQKKCLQKILDFKKKGITIVYVTHNIQDLQTMCDRALWLENHEIKLLGPAQEVANEYLQTMEA